MTTPSIKVLPKSEARSVRVLAELGKDTLVKSAQGFLLVFRGRSPSTIAHKLRSCDAEEWYEGIRTEYQQELDGLAPLSLMYDASPLLATCKHEALAQLDKEILNVTRGNLEFYNLLHSTTPFRTRARLQALTVLPMLMWEFQQMNDTTDRIRRRIDAGKSVWDAFLEIHPGKAAILRRIAAAASGPEAWRGNLAGLLAALDPLPPEKVPKTELEWTAFHSIYLGLALEGEDRDLRIVVKTRWLGDCARLGWIKAYERLAAIEGGVDALADTFDFLDEIGAAGDFLAKRVDQPNISWQAWREQCCVRWMRAAEMLGMFRLVEASVRWHRALWTEAGFLDSTDGRRSFWPQLFTQPVTLDSGIEAISLHSAEALALEGRRLRHCVGSYWRHCFVGNSHIVSLRDTAGHSLSTLELRIPGNGAKRCEVVQHRAAGNQAPEKSLRALESRLCEHVMAFADFKALAEWRHSAKKLDTSLSEAETDTLSGNFSEKRFDRLFDVLGRNRLLGLFGDVAAGIE